MFKRLMGARTVDKDFQDNAAQLRRLKKQVENLQKVLKKYQEAQRTVAASDARVNKLIQDFRLVFDDESGKIEATLEYMSIADHEVRENESALRHTLVEPVDRYRKYFGPLEEAVKRRDQKLKDFEHYQDKVKEIQRQNLKDPARADQERLDRNVSKLDASRDEYAQLNAQLKEELALFYQMRIDYYNSCLEGMARALIDTHGTKMAAADDALAQTFDGLSDAAFDAALEAEVAEFRKLSIVGAKNEKKT